MNDDEPPEDFDVDEHAREHGPEARARALQSLLIEKELLSADAVDRIVATYEEEIGPLNGARVVARAWTDPGFRERLLDDGTGAIEAMDVDVDTETMDVEVVANAPETHNLVVCTLCSCYPWAVLGLPPTWYKTPAYRSRAVRDPRGLLREEFGVDLADDVEIRVWDSTSELRYMVLPQRPPGTEDASEAELVDLVTRDAMVGVERLGGGEAAADGGVDAADADRLADLVDDEPAFDAPWQARAFALAVALRDGGHYEWSDFRERLAVEIDDRDAETVSAGDRDDPESVYYEQWLAALEGLLVEVGTVTGEEFAARTAEFAAGDRDAHEFVEGDPHGHAEGHDPPDREHGHSH